MVNIEKYLARVIKPQRYINTELNVVKKDWDSAKVRLCLAFPDVYEVGMSYFGFQILYELVNSHPEYLAERSYTPWIDLEKIMRRERLELFSWESRRPLREFDIIGFTLPHELNFTNVLTMIDLSRLEIESSARTEPFPLIIGGGECALSPEPIAPFFDAFVLGDGENIILDVLKIIRSAKEKTNITKEELLAELQSLDGIYVPSFYEFDYAEDGRIIEFRAKKDAPPIAKQKQKFTRQIVSLKATNQVRRPLVPLMRIVHERAVVEVRRGCTAGCRFCRAGMINRPIRERPTEQIIELARSCIKETGYDEVSLLSLNTIDYSQLPELIDELDREIRPEGVSIGLPSLRIGGFALDIAERLVGVRKSGLTFAPETGTERLARVINKPWSQAMFLEIVDELLRRGWRTIKLYFMIGLPTETFDDLDGIADLIKAVAEKGRTQFGKKFQLNVTISPFVPKPHTPFQWEAQPPLVELQKRLNYIRKKTKSRNVKITDGDCKQSFLEGVLSRGDRRLAEVIKEAWRNGARFDNWQECFNLEQWLNAFSKVGLQPEWYANREREANELFPWEHIDCRVSRSFLWEERQKAYQGRLTPDCAINGECSRCGVCEPSGYANELAKLQGSELTQAGESKLSKEVFDFHKEPSFRLRLFYSKKGLLRFLSHLDITNLLLNLFRRAGLPLTYTRGWNPQPRVQFAPPLPLGYEGKAEIVDVWLCEPVDFPLTREMLNSIVPEGLQFNRLQNVELHAPSIEAVVQSAEYLLIFPDKNLTIYLPDSGLSGLLNVSLTKTNKKTIVRLHISLRPGEYKNPLEILSQLTGKKLKLADMDYLSREKIFLKRH